MTDYEQIEYALNLLSSVFMLKINAWILSHVLLQKDDLVVVGAEQHD